MLELEGCPCGLTLNRVELISQLDVGGLHGTSEKREEVKEGESESEREGEGEREISANKKRKSK